MGNYIFDFSSGKPVFTLDDKTAIDDSGNILLRVGSNMVTDLSTGEAHFTSEWDTEGSFANGDSFDSDADF